MTTQPNSPRLPFHLCLGVIASLLACERDTAIFERDAARAVADRYCAELFTCRCLDPAGFASEESCALRLTDDLLGVQLDAVKAGLVYDAACIDARIDDIGALGCARDPSHQDACTDCFAYHGAVPQDGPCERHGAFSDCAQGLACVTREGTDGLPVDVCAPACGAEREGEPCSFEGPGFHSLRDCAEGLFCDADTTGRCAALPRPGAPCALDALCAAGGWCDASTDPPICAALKPNGDGCDGDLECASTWCDGGGRCREPIAEGAVCVFDRDRCDVGLVCTEDAPFCAKTDALQCLGAPTSL